MGCQRIWQIIYTIFCFLSLLSSSRVNGSLSYDTESLDESIRNYAMEALVKRQRTGILINVSLPANFSDMEVSIVRLRSGSFWERGANFSSFYIPPMVLPFPFVKRLAIVYQNLGNLSSHYYKVAGYSLVAPVAGFAAYDATNLTTLGDEKLKFNVMGGDIVVNFGNIGELKFGNEEEMKCVKFGDGGLVQFRNLMEGYRCLTQGDGHFSIAVPSKEDKEKKRKALWAIRFATGFVGLVLVIVILVTTYKLVRSKRVRQMEGESDNGVTIDVHWIGSSKMPSASMVRTQPVLEHDDVP